MKEKITDSDPVEWSYVYYICPISTNKTLMEKWLENEEIKVITKNSGAALD